MNTKKIFLIYFLLIIQVFSFLAYADSKPLAPTGICDLYADTINETINLHKQGLSSTEVYQKLLSGRSSTKYELFFLNLPMAIYQILNLMEKSGDAFAHKKLLSKFSSVRENCNNYYVLDFESINNTCQNLGAFIDISVVAREQKNKEEILDKLLEITGVKSVRTFFSDLSNNRPDVNFAATVISKLYQNEIVFVFNHPEMSSEELKNDLYKRCMWP